MVMRAWRREAAALYDAARTLAADPLPRVRLHAVIASTYLDTPAAVEIPLIATDQPGLDLSMLQQEETLQQMILAAIETKFPRPLAKKIEGLRYVAAGGNPIAVKRGIDKAVEAMKTTWTRTAQIRPAGKSRSKPRSHILAKRGRKKPPSS